MLRDCTERGRNVENVLFQYNRFVKTAYDEYIKPTMKYSNLIVPFGSDNTTAIDFIIQNLLFKLLHYKLFRKKRISSEETKELLKVESTASIHRVDL